jgi:methylated-DNA-protein-cysteine methyltransferase related protein
MGRSDEEFRRRVVTALGALRPGEVVTYGELAAEAGRPTAARAVGRLLRDVDDAVPWWRVVRADGRLAAPDRAEQARRLSAEGVVLDRGGARVRASRAGTPANPGRGKAPNVQ